MTFDIEIAGRTRRVAIESAGGTRYRITIDGQPHVVDAVRTGELSLSLIADGDSGTSREAQIVPGTTAGESVVWLDGLTALLTVDGRRSRSGHGGPGRAGAQPSVLAPMPGRVVRVLVAVGDDVSAGQPVAIVEAMKMENELRAPRAGRVKDVLVAEGAPVEAGRVLVIIE